MNWPTKYSCKLMEAGIISYEDSGAGIAYLTKQTIDKIAPSLIGKPVVIRHQKVTPDNSAKVAVGYVTGVHFEPADAWHYVDFLITSDKVEAIDREDGCVVFKAPDGQVLDGVSGAYDVLNVGPGGVWHDIKFDGEIIDGSFTHLALVINPRYEETNQIREANFMLVNGKVATQMETHNSKSEVTIEPAAGEPEGTFRVVLKQDGKEKDHVLVKGKDAAEKQAARWRENSKENAKIGLSLHGQAVEGRFSSMEELLKQKGYKTEKDLRAAGFETFEIKENAQDHDAMFAKEKKEHPEFKDEDIEKIVQDHLKKQNSKEGFPMNIFKIFRKADNGKALDIENATAEVEGKEVPMKDLIENYKAQNAKDEEDKKKKDEEAAANAKTMKQAKDDDEVDVDGKKVKVSELKNCWAKKNEKETDEDKAKREKEEKDKKDKENAKADEDKKKKDEDEAKEKEKVENAKKLLSEKLNAKKSAGEIFIANNSKLEKGAALQNEGKDYLVVEADTVDGKEGFWCAENAKKMAEYFSQIENAGKNVDDGLPAEVPQTREARAARGNEKYGRHK